jgi:hypothetical protein
MRTSPTARRAAITLATAIATALPVTAAPAAAARTGWVVRYADFRDTSALTLNGSAEVAETAGQRPVLRLTSGARDQAGSVWAKTKLRPTASFRTTFELAMTGGAGHGDGLAFVLQSDGRRVLGGLGGSIGYGGLSHSVAVELDTYANPTDVDDNHVAIVTGGRADEPQDAVPAPTPLFGQSLRVRISYDATAQVMKVWLRPLTPGALESRVLTRDINLKSTLGDKRFWIGFTAGTGESVSTQEIHNWTVKTTG